MFAFVANMIFNVVAWFVAHIGNLLDYVVRELVLNMADLVNDIEAIDSLWEIFRDLGNIAFIGVLLYIAIRTILNVGNNFNTKKIMVRLVVVALFVNFSLFAAKVVIDTSNVVALQFYNSIQVEGCEQEEGCNISHFFAGATNISSVQSAESIRSDETIQSAENVNFKIFLARTMGILFLLTTGFVMGAMALLLIIRFGFLVLLMVVSPLAFIAFILPNSKLGQEWWDKLLGQSFFAPALFAMMYVVAVLAADLQNGISEGNTDLMEAILSPDSDNLGVFLVFIIMIFLMSASLVVAKKMGAAGAAGAIKVGKQARNWGQATVMRGTVGRAARISSEKLEKSRLGNTAVGNALLTKPAKNIANKKFGGSKSAAQAKKESRKRKGRLESIKARENVKQKVDAADNDAKKRRHLSKLSSREKVDSGKKFLEDNAHLLSENDFKAIDREDKFSERDKQSIKEAALKPLQDLKDRDPESLSDQEVGKIKSLIGSRSDNQLKDIDIDIISEPSIVQNLSSSQLDTVMKNKSREEKNDIKREFVAPLEQAISDGEADEFLNNKKEKDIIKLLELADNDIRTNPQIVDRISKKIFSDLSSDLKSGETDELHGAITDRWANNPNPTRQNEETALHLMQGPGRAIS